MKTHLCNLPKCLCRYMYFPVAIIIVYLTTTKKLGYELYGQGKVSHIIDIPAPDRRFASVSSLKDFTSPNFLRLINITENKNSSGGVQLIPHIIHQIWDSDEIPVKFQTWVATWPKFHPTWQYWLWTHTDFRQLLELVDPVFLKDYDSYTSGQSRADVMKFYIMYYFGGLYADLDIQVLKPLDKWTFRNHCILPEETYAHPFILNNFTHSPAMLSLLLCRPGHPFYKLAINRIQQYTTRTYTKKLLFVDDVYQAYLKDEKAWTRAENQIYLAPPEFFLPTWDPATYNTLNYRCTSTPYMSKMTKKQKEICYALRKEQWINIPKKESYTNHHWVHVIMNEKNWKEAKSIPIKKIIPNWQLKNVTEVITTLKARANVNNYKSRV